ncbi:MAG: ABC transporter permease, partial [Chloroflexota bacterium]|nr:ABC transporter permease [Chloroflexota bacterium]
MSKPVAPLTGLSPIRSIAAEVPLTHSRFRRTLYRLSRRPAAVIGGVVILLFMVVAVLAPVISPADPNEISSDRRAAPSLEHHFGTDELGRDVLSRVIYGAQISLRVGLVSIAIALIGGSVLGVVAGLAGGW